MTRTLTALLTLSFLLTACGDEDERITQLETALAELQTSTSERLVELETKVADLESTTADNQTAIAANTASVSDLEHLTEPMSRMDVADADSIVFEGVNVHVRNGLGEMACDDGAGTLPACNGVGNLLVGYNGDASSNQTGSHNVIIGISDAFFSYGGIASGESNQLQAPYSTIIGSNSSFSQAEYSTVVGGSGHFLMGPRSVVVGGYGGTTNGAYAAAIGGFGSGADADYSSAMGGYRATATGSYAVAVGGGDATASGDYSTVTGGRENDALGEYSTVSGGYQRSTGDTAPANQYDWVAGSLFEDQ